VQQVTIRDQPSEPAGNDHFSGEVRRRDLAAVDAPSGTALLVTFEPGARTHWHSHPNGQFLYAVEGEGRVVARDGEVARLRAGDLVYAPPGEEHWHGATESERLSHLALSFGETEWLEEVDQASYEAAAR
jgi:quercetin dioxygenase-like cupin family protein